MEITEGVTTSIMPHTQDMSDEPNDAGEIIQTEAIEENIAQLTDDSVQDMREICLTQDGLITAEVQMISIIDDVMPDSILDEIDATDGLIPSCLPVAKKSVKKKHRQHTTTSAISQSVTPVIRQRNEIEPWVHELLHNGSPDFMKICMMIQDDLGARYIEVKNKVILLFEAPVTHKRVAITCHKPHGSQMKKKWPAWRKEFIRVFRQHGILT